MTPPATTGAALANAAMSGAASAGHVPYASTSSAAGSTSTVKDGMPATRRIVGSGSNTELRAQIRRERKLQQQQIGGGGSNNATATHAGTASTSSSLGPAAGAAVSQQLARPASALSNRPPSANATTTAGAAPPAGPSSNSRRTASASSLGGVGLPRSGSSTNLVQGAGTQTAGMQRAASHQHHLAPPTHGAAPVASQQRAQHDHTAFSIISHTSTLGHGHERGSSQGYAASQPTQTLEPPHTAWPKELEPAVHSSVIDAIINNFQTKYAEAAMKCKDWQTYASKLKTQSRALNMENRLLQQLNERHQEQIQILKLKLDTASDERDRSELERSRLEGRVEELEALLLSQGQSHLRAENFHPARYMAPQAQRQGTDFAHGGRIPVAPSPGFPQLVPDIAHRPIRNGPARLQAATRQLQQQQAHAQALLAAQAPHLGYQGTSLSHEIDPSELYQTAIDAATAAFETGLDLSVPSAPQWDDAEYGDENEPPVLHPSQHHRAEAGRVLRRSGTLQAPQPRGQSRRSASQRSNARNSLQHGPLLTSDDEDSSASSESESESESDSEHQRQRNSLVRASMVAMSSMLPHDQRSPMPERPPTPTGYQQTRRESSGFNSFPSPDDVRVHHEGENRSPQHGGGVPMHMHSSPPFQLPPSATNRGLHARSNAHSHQASLIGTIAFSHTTTERRVPDPQLSRAGNPPSQGQVRTSDDGLANSMPPAVVSPSPPHSPALVNDESDDDFQDGRASPGDILTLDAERREEVGPSPLIGFSDANFLYPDGDDHHEFEIATGSPMAGHQYGLGLRVANGNTQDMAIFQPLRLEGPASTAGLPPSDSHQTLVDGGADPKLPAEPATTLPHPSASVRSNGAQRYTVLSPARTKSSNGLQAASIGFQGNLTFASFSSVSGPPKDAAQQKEPGENQKRAAAPPVTTLASGQGNAPRTRSSNSTDPEVARSSASVPSLPFMPNSRSAPAGLSDVTNLQRQNNPTLLAPGQGSARIRAQSTLSEAATVRDGGSSRGVGDSDREGDHVPTRPMSLNLPPPQRDSGSRISAEGLTASLVAATQPSHPHTLRTASRNSNMSVASFHAANGQGGGVTSSINAVNRASAGTLSVNSIGGEHLARARNRSRASSHSVHDAIPVVVKDDVFSDAGHGASGALAASEAKLANTGSSQSLATSSSIVSRASGNDGNSYGRSSSHLGHASSSGAASHAGRSTNGGAANVTQSAIHSRASTNATSSGGYDSQSAEGNPPPDKENAHPPVLLRGSSTSTLASTQQSLSPDLKRSTEVLSARSSTTGPRLSEHGGHAQFQSQSSQTFMRGSSSGLAALSPSISRGGRGAPRLDAGHISFSRTPMNAVGLHVREDDAANDSGYAQYHGQDQSFHSGGGAYTAYEPGHDQAELDEGEADGVGPHRQLYARLRSTLEPSHLAKFEKYVHRYDALDIPLEGPRGLINRVRKLLLRGEPDLVDRPDRLKLMKDLLREFEALVRVEMPSTSGPPHHAAV